MPIQLLQQWRPPEEVVAKLAVALANHMSEGFEDASWAEGGCLHFLHVAWPATAPGDKYDVQGGLR